MKTINYIAMLTGVLSCTGVPMLSVAEADLTGTWEGQIRCEGFNGEAVKDQGPSLIVPVYVSQYNSTDPNGPAQPILCLSSFTNIAPTHTGRVIESVAHPGNGEMILVGLGINPTITPGQGSFHLGRGTFSIGQKDTLDATMTQVGFAVDPGITYTALTCKWRFDRVDTVDPGFVCPP